MKVSTQLHSCLLMVLLFSCGVWADIAVQTKNDYSAGTFTGRDAISSTDLINTGSSTLSSVYSPPMGSFIAANLNDGGADITAWTNYDVAYTIFYLDTTSNQYGYDITGVNVFSCDSNWRAFLFQDYDIKYHLVGEDEGVWHVLASNVTLANSVRGVSTGGTNAGQFAQGQETSIYDDADAALVTNVDAIYFDFSRKVFNWDNYALYTSNPTVSGGCPSVFQEIDVMGTASVPEPVTICLLSGGGLLLFTRKK